MKGFFSLMKAKVLVFRIRLRAGAYKENKRGYKILGHIVRIGEISSCVIAWNKAPHAPSEDASGSSRRQMQHSPLISSPKSLSGM